MSGSQEREAKTYQMRERRMGTLYLDAQEQKNLTAKCAKESPKRAEKSEAAKLCALDGISLRALRLKASAVVERRAIVNSEIEFHFLKA
jgi:hypothetical protein